MKIGIETILNWRSKMRKQYGEKQMNKENPQKIIMSKNVDEENKNKAFSEHKLFAFL